MASLVLKMSVSLDGYVAPVDGSTALASADGGETTIAFSAGAVAHVFAAHPWLR